MYLFKEGDTGDFAYIIESGAVEVFHRRGASKLVLSRLIEGDIVGETALFDNRPRNVSAIALEPTKTIAIPLDDVASRIADADPAIRLFLRYIMVRYRDMHTRFISVFDGIEELGNSSSDATLADTTAEFKSLVNHYQQMRQRLSNAISMSANMPEESPFGEQTLLFTKLQVTQDKSIKSALENNEFVLHFQPVVDLKAKSIVGCEALIRWRTADNTIIPPSEFIPRVEATGLIIDLGYWIVRSACIFQKQLAENFDEPLFVSINLSGKQFEDPFLIDSLTDIMTDTGASNALIKYEITESLLMENPDIAREALHRLKRTGAKLAIDDFGTGYSSFSYLHELPLDTLKIDRAFVNAMSSNLKSNQIVKSLINLSHDLGMDVVAEGITNKSDLKMLRRYGADYGQGFIFSKGLSGKTLIKLINRRLARNQHT